MPFFIAALAVIVQVPQRVLFLLNAIFGR